MKYENFYETLQEAQARLLNTIVLYDKQPYYVNAITEHMKDGIMRVYATPIGVDRVKSKAGYTLPGMCENYNRTSPDLGPVLDKLLDETPELGIRKHINSPLFDNFRPFPLGMCNCGGGIQYVTRRPVRPNTSQGLSSNMIVNEALTLSGRGRLSFDFFGKSFRECIVGDYPSFDMAATAFRENTAVNEGIAFHREFALVRGPVKLILLAYKTNLIGIVSKDLSSVSLDEDFRYCEEAVRELRIFQSIK